jgi:hypothetical protein
MTKLLLGLALVLALSSCGDSGTEDTTGSTEPPASSHTATCGSAAPTTPVAQVDLDGDGTPESVGYAPARGTCPARLTARVAGHDLSADLSGDPSGAVRVTSSAAAAVALPGREGDVLLVRASHPRGGFQADLFGYADGKFAELTAEGKPLFDFVATDSMSTPTAARCDGDGFALLQARAHEPIGVVAAWDVFRTVYSVDGNAVTKGATTEIADNVLDHELQSQYGDLVTYDFFSSCLVTR